MRKTLYRKKLNFFAKKDRRGFPRNTYGGKYRKKYGKTARKSFNKMQKHY